jgi:hypothetical protein
MWFPKEETNMETSEQINELAPALSKLQSSISNPVKDAKAHHSRYASFPSVLNTIRPHLAENGLSIVQTSRKDELYGSMHVIVTTRLLHSSGQWIQEDISSAINMKAQNSIQDMGSLISYLKRYAIQGLVLIAGDDDDDGEAAARTQPVEQDEKFKPIIFMQMQELTSLAKKKGVNIDLIAKAYQCNELKDMSVTQYAQAKKKLESKPDKES